MNTEAITQIPFWGCMLNIPELRLDEGRLVVEGELRTAEYEGRMREGKGGLLGRLFR